MAARFGRGRTPDPDRPGTVYRARPALFRRGDGSLPPAGGPVGGPVAARPPEPPAGFPPAAVPPGPGEGFRGGPAGPPPRLAGPPPAGGGRGRGRPTGRRRRRPGRIVVAVLAVLVLGYPLVLFAAAWSSLTKVAALPDRRPADLPGRTFLVVGSDSREGLSTADRKRLTTGGATGRRTDTIMLLHVPAGDGPTVLVSIPRDSYVEIPGRGKNKINAAYSFGGPRLLVRTVESATGIVVDEYVETGLGGYAALVDAVGGVRVCSPRAIKDVKAGLDIPRGCQQMDGATALGYARARYSDPRGDLGRVERQRQVLAAIAGRTLSPGVVLAPWRAVPAASAGGGALVVDEGTTPLGLARFVLAMRAVAGGDGLSLTVPVGDANLRTPAGSSVAWDEKKAAVLFDAIKDDDTARIAPLAKEQERAAAG